MKPPEQIDITQDVVQKVNAGQVKMRARWEFIAKEIGLESGILLSIAVSIALLSFSLYLWQQYRISSLMGLGPWGWQKFASSFPFELIGLVALLLVGINYLIRKTEWGYKRSRWFWHGIIVFIIVPLALIANSLHATLKLHQTIWNAEALGFRGYFEARLQDIEKSFMVGTLTARDAETLSMRGDDARIYTARRQDVGLRPRGYTPQVGDRVIFVGEWKEQDFHAQIVVGFEQIKQRWDQQ